MKKLIICLLTVVLLLVGSTAFAENNVVGHIYSTDILAFVNGKPIDGYNIGGRTVVIAEDLDNYGFHCFYDDNERKLEIVAYFYELGNDLKIAEIPRGKVGKVVGDIYKTDIKVFLNGIEIKGYNIGGRTAICLEDMGDLQDSPNLEYGYSKYLGKSIWDESKRTISFESFIRNENKIMGMLARVSYNFKDNVLYAYPDELSKSLEIRPINENPAFKNYENNIYSEDFPKGIISPLYIDVNGEKKEVGFAINNPNSEYEVLMHFYDVTDTIKLTAQAKSPRKSYDESMDYFLNKYELVNKLDNDKYTVLHINDSTDGVLFVYINKNGGFIIDDFFRAYSDSEVKIWLDEEEQNLVHHSVYPFAGPHGATTMSYESNLDSFDYE